MIEHTKFKIYAESIRGADYLRSIQEDAQTIVDEYLEETL
jgi:phosphoglucomutase